MTLRNLILAAVAVTLTVLSSPSRGSDVEYDYSREEVARLGRDIQRQVGGLQYVLNGYQLRQVLALESDDLRQQWIDRFWMAKDPTPTTTRNEMLIEHTIRVKLARQFFKSKQWPGWDKRGEVFIRYGPPNVRAKVHAEVTVRKTHPPGELWFYGRHRMIVMFRDHNLNGFYSYAINALGATQDMDTELAEYLLYEADTSLETVIPADMLSFYRATETDPDAVQDWTPMHEALQGTQPQKVLRPRMRGVSEDWNEVMDPDTPGLIPNNPADVFHMQKAEELANRFEETLEETPAAYPFNFETDRFPFFFGIEQFKGGGDVNRIEVNIEFPVEPAADNENSPTRTYQATAVFFDSEYKEISRGDRELVVPVFAGDEERTRLMPAQLVFSLSEDYYRMAVTVSEVRGVEAPDSLPPTAKRESSYRSNVSFKPFNPDLAISDILFAQKIEAAEKQSPFIRGALEVVPHPVRRYRRGTAVPVYFEVYNLGLNEDKLSSYTVEYRIVPHSPTKARFWDRFDKEPTVVSSRFQSSGFGADEPLYVTVKSENLRPGAYDFLVTVKDDYSQDVAYRRATFRIVE